jgi:hypothetical protein
MPHDLVESHHPGSDHYSPVDHHDDVKVAIQTVAEADAPSGQAPAQASYHHHLVADAVDDTTPSFAPLTSVGPRKLPANDALLTQEDISLLLEPPIA